MAKAWMPLYIGDYLGDTSHLSQGHHGAYLLLMMHYWQKGMLQASPKHCYTVARAHTTEEQQAVCDVLQEFFVLGEDGYHNHRIDVELSRVSKVSAANKEKASKAAHARWKAPTNAPSIPQALPQDADSQSKSQSKENPIKTLSATADVALEILLVDETLFPITSSDVEDWTGLFPKVNVVDILAKIRTTCQRHPSKRKNGDGIRNHIVACLKMMQTQGEAFERVWARFPNKVGKKEAERHFKASVHTDDDLRDMHRGLDNYVGLLQSNPTRSVQNGSTWFNNWKDWVNWEDPKNGRQGTDGSSKGAGAKAGAVGKVAGTTKQPGFFAGDFVDKSDQW